MRLSSPQIADPAADYVCSAEHSTTTITTIKNFSVNNNLNAISAFGRTVPPKCIEKLLEFLQVGRDTEF
ncbi:hypothetical protein R1flu_002710 [Riccia fluitans]|uniref:Uncharacterized protein n=1 Tax=Riccia fluitans TaxID=41844 RepID=A0ABD1Y7F0_9MARC